MKLEGPVCCVEMKLSSVSLDWRKLSSFQSLLVKDEVDDFSVWKLGSPVLSCYERGLFRCSPLERNILGYHE